MNDNMPLLIEMAILAFERGFHVDIQPGKLILTLPGVKK